MAENFGLVRKSLRPKLDRMSYFTPEGKMALMFLKKYTVLSCPKLMEQLNGNIHYQMFCDVIIDPTKPLTNYRLLDDIILGLSGHMQKASLTYRKHRKRTKSQTRKISRRLFGVDAKKIGGDTGYA